MSEKLYKIAIALGGNIGDSEMIFSLALNKLSEAGVCNIKISSLMKSKPDNCPPGSPDFTNAVLVGEWMSSPQKLLKLCQDIESAAGRPAERAVNAPRTLDLDIILFGDEIIDSPDLQVPHSRAAQRLFVMGPLAEIAPDWTFPDINRTVREIYHSLVN